VFETSKRGKNEEWAVLRTRKYGCTKVGRKGEKEGVDSGDKDLFFSYFIAYSLQARGEEEGRGRHRKGKERLRQLGEGAQGSE